MNEITYPLISSQLPEQMAESAPLLAEFLETYFKYEDQRNKSIGLIQNKYQNNDIDLCDEQYVTDFYSEYGQFLPREVAMDKRNFIKILNQIYEAKGTERALKLLFQAVFGEKITVSFPGEASLRASDGIWVREKYVTLVTKFGTPPTGIAQLSFSTEIGNYVFETTRTEIVSNLETRFYFESFTNGDFEINQRVYWKDSNGITLYVGDLIASPSFLTVVSPGKSWQIGQIIIIPGSNTNTIAKVTGIDSLGGITAIQIVSYGAEHPEGQIVTVSPYPNKPNSASVAVESVITSTSPLTYSHTVTIEEYVSEIEETVIGISDRITIDSYFLEDYVEQSYSGQVEFTRIINPTGSSTIDTGDLTIEEWLASRATLTYNYDNVVELPGYYLTDAGQLSNQAVKLQDNFFYQAFSYLIETSQDISKYQQLLNIAHPAGTKRFSTLNKNSDIELLVTSEREISDGIIFS